MKMVHLLFYKDITVFLMLTFNAPFFACFNMRIEMTFFREILTK